MSHQGRFTLPLAIIALFSAMGCHATPPTGPVVPITGATAVAVNGATLSVAVGASIQLAATATFGDGSVRDVTGDAVWTSSNDLILTVGAGGRVVGEAAGTASALAAFDGKTGSLGLSVLPFASGIACGVERWAVKTLSDASASLVNPNQVQATTIRDLNQQPAHCGSTPNVRTYTQEFQVFEVTGKILIVRSEDDKDYHVALTDVADAGFTMVAELANPICQGAATSPFAPELAKVRNDFDVIIAGRSLSSMVGTTLKVRGVGFYDFNHGQTGRSQSCIELHPLLGVQVVPTLQISALFFSHPNPVFVR